MTGDDFKVIKNFIGFGNPRGAYWFIGIEEASEWEDDKEEDRRNIERFRRQILPAVRDEIKTNEENRKKEGKRFTRIYDYMSYLVLASTGRPSDDADCLRYRNDKLLQEGGETFQTNLYPLGKRSIKHWNEYCARLTGSATRKEYYKEIEPYRRSLIISKWEECPPAITICFGASCWDNFKKLFEHQCEAPYKDLGWCRTYEAREAGIILAPFFIGHKLTNAYKKDLASEIRRIRDKLRR